MASSRPTVPVEGTDVATRSLSLLDDHPHPIRAAINDLAPFAGPDVE